MGVMADKRTADSSDFQRGFASLGKILAIRTRPRVAQTQVPLEYFSIGREPIPCAVVSAYAGSIKVTALVDADVCNQAFLAFLRN